MSLKSRRAVATRTLDNAAIIISEAEKVIRDMMVITKDDEARSLLKHQIKKLRMAKGICANVFALLARPFDEEVPEEVTR